MKQRTDSSEAARSKQESNRHATRVRRTTLLFIERRRLRVTADLQRLRLPRRRYEDLCLAVALCRSQRRCVARLDEPESTANRCLVANLDAQLAELEGSLAKIERWLSPAMRADAEAEAEVRFRGIADTIRHELGAAGLLPDLIAPSPEPPEASVPASSPELPEPPVPTSTRCTATTRKGNRCKNPVRDGGLCAVHARQLQREGSPEGEAKPESEANPEREVALPAVEPRPVPAVVGAAATRAVATAALERLPVPHPWKLRFDPQKLRFDPQRIDARFAWPIGGTAAVAAATALIWSGLSAGGHGAVGSGVAIDPNSNQAALSIGYTSADRAEGETRDDWTSSRGDRNRSSGGGEPEASGGGRGEPETILARAGGPDGASHAAGDASASPSAPAPAPAPSPEPDPAPSPEPDPAPTPEPSPEPEDPAPDNEADGAPDDTAPSTLLGAVGGAVEEVTGQLPRAGDLIEDLPGA